MDRTAEPVDKIAQAMDAFRRRGFSAKRFKTGEEAIAFFLSEISATDSIGHGGSDTLRELGLLDRLREGEYRFLDRYVFEHGYEEQLAIRRKNLCADVFVASSNAVSIDGALVNVDGDGNRVSAIAFGPRRVYLFVGRNKLCDGTQEAIDRARNVAAVSLAARLGKATPCVRTGVCQDCLSPDRICSTLTITDRCHPEGRIHLLFIDEDLGL